MTFEKKLKAVCQNCKPNSIRLYTQNVKRLYRFLEPDAEEIPDSGDWLKKPELFKKLEAIPVNKRRHLTLAGVKAGSAYKLPEKIRDKWYSHMMSDSNEYQENRKKNEASPYEKKNAP